MATKIIKNISMAIWWLCWTTFIIRVLVWITLTHASMDLDYHPITLCLLCSQKPPKAYNILRTFQSPSESINPMGVKFCFVVQHNSPIRYTSWAKHSLWLELWVLAIGYWRLGMVYGLEHVALPLFIPLTFCLIAHSLPKVVFWRICQRQMHERYEVARVKTTEEFGEHHYSTEGRNVR